jgi:hypothetical protein
VLESNHENLFHGEMAASWSALGEGGPTLAALAAICARRIYEPAASIEPEMLSIEARTLLFAARERGILEVRGVSTAFEAPARMLAIYIEEAEDRTIAFRDRARPEITVAFFEGFCELCRAGLVMHHLHRDFSLTKAGFRLARDVQRDEVVEQLNLATEFGLHD